MPNKKLNTGIDFFEAPHSHLHVGTSPLQKPLGPHILLFDPTSIYPSGQTYSIVEPTVLLDPTIIVFSDFSGLPQVGGPVKRTNRTNSIFFFLRDGIFMRCSRVFFSFSLIRGSKAANFRENVPRMQRIFLQSTNKIPQHLLL